MNNFPAMTEAQRHKMISDCQAEIVEIEKALTTWGEGWVSYLQSKLKRQKIALAALTRDNAKLAREIVRRLVDGGAADPEVVASSEAWVLKKLNGVKS